MPGKGFGTVIAAKAHIQALQGTAEIIAYKEIGHMLRSIIELIAFPFGVSVLEYFCVVVGVAGY